MENKKNFTSFIIGGVVLFILIFGIVVVIGSRKETVTAVTATPSSSPSADTSTDSQVKTFNVEEGSYYFKPNEIKVNKGDKVKIIFTDKDGIHDFVVDDFNVKTDRISGGQTAQVEFTADKTGTFDFYCSVGAHRQLGMTGKLIVN